MMKESNDFIPPYPLHTAVLFLVFNRLDTATKVLEAIKTAKPPRLYIAADGARSDKDGEAENVQEVRDFVMAQIDWDCEVKTLFRDENLGCKMAVSGAINWFFKNEEMGIILEDDVLPSQSFFWFCEALLEKYKDDERVALVSGDNFQDGIKRGEADYYFSIFNHIWGWASWRRAWNHYDIEMKSYPEFSSGHYLDGVFESSKHKKYWLNIFKKMYHNEIDTWDYAWTYACWTQNMLSILPNKNLVSNLGFDERGTHTVSPNDPSANLPSFEIRIPLTHPEIIMRDSLADTLTLNTVFNRQMFVKRVISRILTWI